MRRHFHYDAAIFKSISKVDLSVDQGVADACWAKSVDELAGEKVAEGLEVAVSGEGIIDDRSSVVIETTDSPMVGVKDLLVR